MKKYLIPITLLLTLTINSRDTYGQRLVESIAGVVGNEMILL